MAASQKVEKFEFDGFKKLLICSECDNPPRPGTTIYSCTDRGDKCAYILCDDCRYKGQCDCGWRPSKDSILTQLVSFIKLYNCINLKHGCQEELEAKDLEAHEQICKFRNVNCPMLDCNDEMGLNGILKHYAGKHCDLKIKDDILEFKGTPEDLEKSTFILACNRPLYSSIFYPQFQVKENLLHFWVVGHGNRDEMNSFEVYILFLFFLLFSEHCLNVKHISLVF